MYLTKEKLKQKVNNNLKKQLNQEEYEVKKQSAIMLLTPKRFDLLAKYTYVKFKVLNIDSNFGKELYLAHIKAFNNFFENDESQKVGKDAFLKSFDDLIESISKNGIDKENIIPVSNNILLDGAHRTATAIYFNKKLNTVELDVQTPKYNYNFFQDRGLDELYLDYMATTYIELKDNVYTIILWPSSGGGKEKELQNILDEYGQIVYRKELKLKNYAPMHLVKQAYKNEDWLGSAKDGFIGVQNKAKWCFDKDAPLRVILFESDKDMIEMKDKIRELYQIKKHAVHINDTKEEALELAGLLFNQNSIHWMNTALLSHMPIYEELFHDYKVTLESKKDYLIIGAILASYGVKDANDLDYISHNSKNKIDFKNKLIEEEKSKIKYLNTTVDDLIFNPKNYFLIDNVKIMTLELMKNIKLNRKKGSDVKDILLIDKLLEGSSIKINIFENLKLLTNLSFLKGKIKFILLKVRFYITKTLQGIKK